MGVWGTVCRPGRAEQAQDRCGRQDDPACQQNGGGRDADEMRGEAGHLTAAVHSSACDP